MRKVILSASYAPNRHVNLGGSVVRIVQKLESMGYLLGGAGCAVFVVIDVPTAVYPLTVRELEQLDRSTRG
jgi:hypothetical protein